MQGGAPLLPSLPSLPLSSLPFRFPPLPALPFLSPLVVSPLNPATEFGGAL